MRGPLAHTGPSKGSSSHSSDHARAAAPASIFLLRSRTPAPGHRKCPPRRPIAARGLGVTPRRDPGTPRPRVRSRRRDGGERGAPPEVPRLEAEPLNPIGERAERSRLPEGKGSILERQLCSRSQSRRPSARRLRPGRTPAGAQHPASSSDRRVPDRTWRGGGGGTSSELPAGVLAGAGQSRPWGPAPPSREAGARGLETGLPRAAPWTGGRAAFPTPPPLAPPLAPPPSPQPPSGSLTHSPPHRTGPPAG